MSAHVEALAEVLWRAEFATHPDADLHEWNDLAAWARVTYERQAEAVLAAGFAFAPVLAAAVRDARAAELRKLADEIDVDGYGWTGPRDAARFIKRLRDRADRIDVDAPEGTPENPIRVPVAEWIAVDQALQPFLHCEPKDHHPSCCPAVIAVMEALGLHKTGVFRGTPDEMFGPMDPALIAQQERTIRQIEEAERG